jgi:hypothetical protein
MFKRMLNSIKNVKFSIDKEIELITSKLREKLMIEKKRIILKLLMNWQRSMKVTNEMIGNNVSDESNATYNFFSFFQFL